MFDKAFFKFALGFTLIIMVSVFTLYVAGYLNTKNAAENTASIGK